MSDSNISKELMLRSKKTGQWIKRSEQEVNLSDNYIPKTFIQVINNNIHYADTQIIISEIIKNRKEEKIYNFETIYNNILDYLENYKTYSSGIEKVFDGCESSANEFDNEIRRICSEINQKNLKDLDAVYFKNVTSGYIKILLIYLYSAIVLHKSKVKNEATIRMKIKNLKSYLQSALERILIPEEKHWDGQKLDFNSSLYSAFIYSPKLNIKYIDNLVKYDSRFANSLELVRCLNNGALNFSSKDYEPYISFSGKFKKKEVNDFDISFIIILINLLEDVDRLQNIRDEMDNIEDINIFEELTLYV
ncbi:hypothetical protein [Pectobacterium carotovorum]|uniref:hypothetical protein n=1 Tax=Pectobacterium carotovorum TaxID=554 RepID=UPI000E738022|nr:hypothetical protein [Pectobacterium carotovorum]RJL47145.1 hypothetical protein D5078_08860 [Pectobacterium carotovorum]UFT96072.1 hypothetical protein LQF52_08680 [Pectobacterium carotovorum]